MLEQRTLCTFLLDGRLFGIDVARVREVVRHIEATRVPLAPSIVGGLLNLRGQIVTAIELRRRLGLAPPRAGALAMHIVLEVDGELVSLIVDEISGMLTVADSDFEPPPASLQGSLGPLVIGVYKLPTMILMVLDVEKVMDIAKEVAGVCSAE